jgi:hypothetical protein
LKRATVLLPLLLPRLSDQAAAQLLELLRELIVAIEYHYAAQIERHRKRQREMRRDYPHATPRSPLDPPF